MTTEHDAEKMREKIKGLYQERRKRLDEFNAWDAQCIATIDRWEKELSAISREVT